MKELIVARARVCSHLCLAGQKTPPARFLYELLGCSQSPSFAELGRAAADKGRKKNSSELHHLHIHTLPPFCPINDTKLG